MIRLNVQEYFLLNNPYIERLQCHFLISIQTLIFQPQFTMRTLTLRLGYLCLQFCSVTDFLASLDSYMRSSLHFTLISFPDLLWTKPKEISAVGENEKPIRKDERRKDLEVICHSGLNNFCNMIVPLPKSQTRHTARAQAPLHLPHMLFLTQNFTNPSPCSHSFFFFALTRSPNLRTKTACRELIPEAF